VREKELVGIVSERDYARKVILLGRSSSDTPVWQIMTSDVVTVSPDDAVHRCMEIMTEKRIRHLPVVDKGELIGIISIGDLVKAVIEEQQQTITQLERYIAGGVRSAGGASCRSGFSPTIRAKKEFSRQGAKEEEFSRQGAKAPRKKSLKNLA